MISNWSRPEAYPALAETIRYFFHLRSIADWAPDLEGTEMATVEDAHREAVRDARELVSRILMTDAQVPWDSAIEVGTIDGKLFEVSFREAVGF